MKILVTGGTGNVGGTVVKELLKRGAEVRVLARKQPEAGKLPKGVESPSVICSTRFPWNRRCRGSTSSSC
jgi:uncharacterized protein YbjT (DUF2867 family)